MAPRRYYGTDSTDEFDTLAELTELPDGSTCIEVVVVDTRGDPTEADCSRQRR